MQGDWGDDYGDSYQAPDDPAQTPVSATSSYGVAPPWFQGSNPPFAPGQNWQTAGTQTDQQGNNWNWNAGSGAWEMDAPAAAAPSGDVSGGGGTGGGGGSSYGTGAGSLIAPFPNQYTPAGTAAPGGGLPMPTVAGSLGNIPGAPTYNQRPEFRSPTMAEAMNDDGYKFVLDQGNQNLQNWAAARGTLNDSSTAKAMIDYGQGAATTQYGNVWNRARDAYQMNNQTQSMEPYQAAYQNWAAGVAAPTMAQYQTNAQNTSHVNDVAWQDNWNNWLQNWNMFRDQRDSTYNKQLGVA